MTQHRITLIVNDLELINTQKRALRKRSEDYLLYRLRTYYNSRKKESNYKVCQH